MITLQIIFFILFLFSVTDSQGFSGGKISHLETGTIVAVPVDTPPTTRIQATFSYPFMRDNIFDSTDTTLFIGTALRDYHTQGLRGLTNAVLHIQVKRPRLNPGKNILSIDLHTDPSFANPLPTRAAVYRVRFNFIVVGSGFEGFYDTESLESSLIFARNGEMNKISDNSQGIYDFHNQFETSPFRYDPDPSINRGCGAVKRTQWILEDGQECDIFKIFTSITGFQFGSNLPAVSNEQLLIDMTTIDTFYNSDGTSDGVMFEFALPASWHNSGIYRVQISLVAIGIQEFSLLIYPEQIILPNQFIYNEIITDQIYDFDFVPGARIDDQQLPLVNLILDGPYYPTKKNQVAHLFCAYDFLKLEYGSTPNSEIDFTVGDPDINIDSNFRLIASVQETGLTQLDLELRMKCLMLTSRIERCEQTMADVPVDVSQPPVIVAQPTTNTGSDVLSHIPPLTTYKPEYDENYLEDLELLVLLEQTFVEPGSIKYQIKYNGVESGKPYEGVVHITSTSAPLYISPSGSPLHFQQQIKINVFGVQVYRRSIRISTQNLPKTIHFSFIAPKPDLLNSDFTIEYSTDFSLAATGITTDYTNFIQFGILSHQQVLSDANDCLATCPQRNEYSVGINYLFSPPLCVYCLEDLYLEFSPSTGQCECKEGYVLKGGFCEICSAQLCSVCNALTNVCEICVHNSQFVNPSVPSLGCDCIQKFYKSDLSCLPCLPGCTDCSDGQTCTICVDNDNTRMPSSSGCKCLPGRYETGEPLCPKCSPQCKTCQTLSTNCLTCENSKKFYLQGSTCICEVGHFKVLINGEAFCEPCNPGCKKCLNTPNNCQQCEPLRIRNSRSECVCQAGYIQYEGACIDTLCSVIPYCQLCNILLSTGQNACTKCVEPRVVTEDYSKCVCKVGYYEESTECKKCKQGCQICESASKCLKCASQAMLMGDGSCSCSSGHYIKQLENHLICGRCESNCEKCEGSPSNCSLCINGFLTINNECVCPSGYYPSMDYSTCLDCGKGCTNCQLGECLSCVSGYYLSEGKCIIQCPTGTFNSANECVQCSDHCSHCLSSIKCNGCLRGFYLFAGSCRQNCPLGTYPIGALCAACPQLCQACQSGNFCLSCQQGYLLSDGKCIQGCGAGKYFFLGSCYPCDSNCLSCQNQSNNCTSCQSNYYLIDGKCKEHCPWTSNDRECIKKCNKNQYKDPQGNCHNCANQCETCSSPTYCQTCRNGLKVHKGKCLNECPQNCLLIDTHCITCDQSCIGCSGSPSSCLRCAPNFYQYLDRCVPHCPEKYYANSTTCMPCDWGCKHCIGPAQCAQCLDDEVPIGGICPKSCGAYCWECENNRCLRCMNGYILANNKCISRCPYGTTLINGGCSCSSGFLFNNQCLPQCPPGFYPWDKSCQKCSPPCQTCVNSAKQCTSCSKGYILDEVTKKCNEEKDCPQGFYQSSIGGCRHICPEKYFFYDSACYEGGCPIGFSTDYSSRSCQKIDTPPGCTHPYFLQGNKCLTSCYSGFYPNIQRRVCDPCLPNCLVCSNSNICEYCERGFTLENGQCIESNGCGSRLVFYESACMERCPEGTVNNKGYCERICQSGTYYWNQCCYPGCPTSLKTKQACVYQCPKGFIENNNLCLLESQKCSSSQYFDFSTARCSSCRSPCSKCKGAPNQCLSCISGFFLSKGTCLPVQNIVCPDKCSRCSEPGRCSACASGYVNTGDDCVKSSQSLKSVQLQELQKSVGLLTVFIRIRPSILPKNLPIPAASKFFIFSTDNPSVNPIISQWVSEQDVIVALSHQGFIPNYKAFLIPNSILLHQIYVSLGYTLANSYIPTQISQNLPKSSLSIPTSAIKQSAESLSNPQKPFNKQLNALTTNAMRQMRIIDSLY